MKKLFNVLILCFLCISTLIAQNSFGPAPASSHQPHQTSMEPMRSLNSPSIVTFDTDINTFELGTPATTNSLGTAPEFLNSCEYLNGMYYGTTSTSGLLLSIDPSTGTVNQIATGNHSGAIAYNPADGLVYGLSLGSSAVLYTIDLTSGTETQVVAVNSANFLLGMTITNEGRFLVIDAEIDGISELDPVSGDLSTFWVSGFTVNYGQDMAMDREENIPYWAAYNADDYAAQLYALDLDNNTGTMIGEFADQASGFATQTISNPDLAAAPTSFVVAPIGQTLSANISWTNPTVTVGNDPLTAIDQIVLTRDGATINTWSNPTVGGAISYVDNVPAVGRYHYSVYAVTSEGNGLPASASAVIGELITVADTAIDFGVGPVGGVFPAQTNVVSGYNLPSTITVSTAAPFSVSSDGTNFSTTANLPAAGGTLYVNFEPTVGRVDNGIVTLTAGTASASFTVTGESVECNTITEFPYNCNFGDESQLICWQIIDENGDGTTWTFDTQTPVAQYRWNSSNAADDWLISPEFTLTGNEICRFDYAAAGSSYPEKFSVSLLQNGTYTEIQPQITVTSTTATTLNLDLSQYTGNYKVAIHAESDADMFYLYISNFSVFAAVPTINVTPTAVDFGTVIAGVVSAPQQVDVELISITEAVTATVAAPFEVSADGTTFGTTATIPAPTTSLANAALYVRYAPTTAATDNGTLTLTDGTLTATVNLTGAAISCDGVTVPFSEGFENVLDPCWQVIDADGDSYSWDAESPVSNGFEAHTGSGLISSASYINNVGALTPDNWLITPQVLNIPAGTGMTFWVSAQDATYPAEHYGVYVSTTTPEISEFQLIYEETMDANGGPRDQGAWKQKSVDLNAYAGQNIYVAFRHFNCTDAFWLNLDDVEIAQGIGIAENEAAANTVSIYPNPATSILNVNANGYNTVEIINMLGQVVYSTTMTDNAQINVRSLNNGVYFVRLNGENGTTTQKFIKK